MKNIKRTIWSNRYEDIEALREDIEQEYDPEEYDLDQLASDLNYDYLEDERMNLNILVDTEILAIADIGRWNGRVRGYKEIGKNIADCLFSNCDIVHWYCDNYNFKATGHHHDGTNYVIYRLRRPHISDERWERFLDKLYYGTASDRDIRRFTTSLRPYVAEVYGW